MTALLHHPVISSLFFQIASRPCLNLFPIGGSLSPFCGNVKELSSNQLRTLRRLRNLKFCKNVAEKKRNKLELDEQEQSLTAAKTLYPSAVLFIFCRRSDGNENSRLGKLELLDNSLDNGKLYTHTRHGIWLWQLQDSRLLDAVGIYCFVLAFFFGSSRRDDEYSEGSN
jgi:hypothetical protein